MIIPSPSATAEVASGAPTKIAIDRRTDGEDEYALAHARHSASGTVIATVSVAKISELLIARATSTPMESRVPSKR